MFLWQMWSADGLFKSLLKATNVEEQTARQPWNTSLELPSFSLLLSTDTAKGFKWEEEAVEGGFKFKGTGIEPRLLQGNGAMH